MDERQQVRLELAETERRRDEAPAVAEFAARGVVAIARALVDDGKAKPALLTTLQRMAIELRGGATRGLLVDLEKRLIEPSRLRQEQKRQRPD